MTEELKISEEYKSFLKNTQSVDDAMTKLVEGFSRMCQDVARLQGDEDAAAEIRIVALNRRMLDAHSKMRDAIERALKLPQ